MKVLQINTVISAGSTGRIVEDIGNLLIQKGHDSYIAFGRNNNSNKTNVFKIGNNADFLFHVMKSRCFDRHGFGSEYATKQFVKQIDKIEPDVIHLHLIHGYYLNVKVLFKYFKIKNIPLVWTFHDCWAFTGHCSYFDAINCNKWQLECNKCPNLKGYPKSWFRDNSRNNYWEKKNIFNDINTLNIITPSNWLAENVSKSFLNTYPIKVIHNGIDLSVFKPVLDYSPINKYNIPAKKFILGVANIWDRRKGLNDFFAIRNLLPDDVQIVLIGLHQNQIKNLPKGITGIERTSDIRGLAELYSAAYIFVNPTYVDNFPTTNLEAISCGTPVITYNTGGSPETIDENSGIVVKKGDIKGLVTAISTIFRNGKESYTSYCIKRSELLFDKNARFNEYIRIYQELTDNRNKITK